MDSHHIFFLRSRLFINKYKYTSVKKIDPSKTKIKICISTLILHLILFIFKIKYVLQHKLINIIKYLYTYYL